ncbi:MAG: hypothetical protein PHW82_15285 [Bacteroidales bacterium]|nr:hypothetical protein [Bacteroidales bacterium]
MFETELQLQKKFVENLHNSKQTNEFIHEEFNARFGNVDIIKVIYNGEVTLSISQAKALTKISNARVIAYLHKKSLRTLNYLIKKTGYSKNQILLSIAELKKLKMIIEVKPDRYLIKDEFNFPNIKFISFEAKLKDWKKAISQSLRNNNFSYKSYVVMPLKDAKYLHNKQSHYFEVYNIGLIGVDDNKNVTFIEPKQNLEYQVSPLFINSIGKIICKKEQVC